VVVSRECVPVLADESTRVPGRQLDEDAWRRSCRGAGRSGPFQT
jgi:hypothetical protein